MFNSGSQNDKGQPTQAMPNHINSGTTIEGSIKAQGNLRIDGTLKGSLTCEGRVVVGKSGFIEGEIKCQNAEVEGTINANLIVSDLLTLKASAKLTGDISTKKLAIEPGATFTGSCSMGGVVKDIQSRRPEQSGQSQPQQEQSATA